MSGFNGQANYNYIENKANNDRNMIKQKLESFRYVKTTNVKI